MSIHFSNFVNLERITETCNDLLMTTGSIFAIEDTNTKNIEKLNLQNKINDVFLTILSSEETLLNTISTINKKSNKREFAQIKQDIFISRLLKKQINFLNKQLNEVREQTNPTDISKFTELTIKIGSLHHLLQKTITRNFEDSPETIRTALNKIIESSISFDVEGTTLLQGLSTSLDIEPSQLETLQSQIKKTLEKNSEIRELALEHEMEFEAWAFSLTENGIRFLERANLIIETTYLETHSTLDLSDESILLCLIYLGFCSLDSTLPEQYLLYLKDQTKQLLDTYEQIKNTHLSKQNMSLRALVLTKNMLRKTILIDSIRHIQTISNSLLTNKDMQTFLTKDDSPSLIEMTSNLALEIGSCLSCALEFFQPVRSSVKKTTQNNLAYFWFTWNALKKKERLKLRQQLDYYRNIKEPITPISQEKIIEDLLKKKLTETERTDLIITLKKQSLYIWMFMKEIEKRAQIAEQLYKDCP